VTKGRVRQKSTLENEHNIPNKEMSTFTPSASVKMKYSIHSIVEEDSKSSSSTSSVKSSDDLTYFYNRRDKKLRKRSSFYTKSLKSSGVSGSDSFNSISSKRASHVTKIKKYTEGAINPLNDIKETINKEGRNKRLNSMGISMAKLTLD
jgi:hypothetical protein